MARVMLFALIVALAGCGQPRTQYVALAPYPLSSPDFVAIPVRATLICDSTGRAKIWDEDPEWRGMVPYEAVRPYGVNDTLTVKFGEHWVRLTTRLVVECERIK
jgi:hypothetical protein